MPQINDPWKHVKVQQENVKKQFKPLKQVNIKIKQEDKRGIKTMVFYHKKQEIKV